MRGNESAGQIRFHATILPHGGYRVQLAPARKTEKHSAARAFASGSRRPLASCQYCNSHSLPLSNVGFRGLLPGAGRIYTLDA
jgi:hypothetical protein